MVIGMQIKIENTTIKSAEILDIYTLRLTTLKGDKFYFILETPMDITVNQAQIDGYFLFDFPGTKILTETDYEQFNHSYTNKHCLEVKI